MGVIYTRKSDGRQLRQPPTGEERAALINRYYRPHHEKLEACVSDCLQSSGRCLVVDCHSFPSVALPYELDQSADRPDICIGTDSFHTPKWLIDTMRVGFEKFGYSTAVNKPFAGSIVPMAFYHKEASVESIMIEVNRKLYMDESTCVKSAGFHSVKRHLSLILKEIGDILYCGYQANTFFA